MVWAHALQAVVVVMAVVPAVGVVVAQGEVVVAPAMRKAQRTTCARTAGAAATASCTWLQAQIIRSTQQLFRL